MSGIGFWTTVSGLLNGMIGSGCLVLPVMGLHIHPLVVTIACLAVGAYSHYTGYLMVQHMGEATSIKEALLSHFGHNPMPCKVYTLATWFKFIFFVSFLFNLTCQQINGLLSNSPWWVPVGLALLFIILTSLLQHFNIGEETIAFGIFSIASFVIFIFWVLLTAPSADLESPPPSGEAGGSLYKLIAVLMTTFIMHTLLPQNIIKNPNR